MGKSLIFDWMHEDDVVAHVECYADTGEVRCTELTNVKHWLFMGKRPHTIPYVLQKLESRCPPRTRPDIDEILEYLGVSSYSVLDIVRKTHARMAGDALWMRFEGETLTYADITMERS